MTVRPRREMTHQESATAHARRRAWQRLGLALSDVDIAAVAARIRKDGKPLAESGNGRRLHLVHYRGRDIHAVFCPVLDCIVTFLPGPAYFRAKPNSQKMEKKDERA